MKEYVIDVDRWRCGGEGSAKMGEGQINMLNEQGYMCCLGQISRQMGIASKCLLGEYTPDDVAKIINKKNIRSEIETQYVKYNPLVKLLSITIYGFRGLALTTLSVEAIEINDNESLTLRERANELKSLFLKNGIKIRFKNIKKHLR